MSVVIPVYNAGKKLRICMESIINQDYENLEIILVNDGSTDNSGQICKEYQGLDNRIRLLEIANQGSGSARNQGIMNSTGKYIYFPDADDFLAKDAISRMVQAMKYEKVDLVVFGYEGINKSNNIYYVKEYSELMIDGSAVRSNYSKHFFISSEYAIQGAPWNKLFDLDVVKKNNILFPNLRRHQDECFIARYMDVASKVHFIPGVLYTYYANSRKDEYKKYPVDYFDVVQKLHLERKKNVYIWNPDDKETHNEANIEYLNGIVKSLELSFYFKKELQMKKSHVAWMRDRIIEAKIENIDFEYINSRYLRMVYSSIKGHKYFKMFCQIKMASVLKKYNIITNY